AFLFVLSLAAPALAFEVGDKRVTMGANLTAEQRALVFRDFGISEGDVPELTITNADERVYLNGLVPDSKIGSVALSCIYIEILGENAGLDITTHNINWATVDMYRNAFHTAGITNAKIIVSAPFPVSGTAALTGAYKAYEDITGKQLADLAKAVGVEELIVTGELAAFIGTEEAAALINELKKILDQTQNMTDDEVRAEIKNIADAYTITLTTSQLEQVLSLCRKLEKLNVDEIKKLAESLVTAQKATTALSNFAQGVKNFFASIGDFFARLFGKKD
ncbi:MAG: DUF1002 domain-containing protein, partial [Clostridiales bacterium]|nr:DUF1002 domain-containing protein [Clostridiales bacterium]